MEENKEITNREVTIDKKKFSSFCVVKKIDNIVKEINELEDYFDNLSNLQSKVDEELSDFLHYIENNTLTPKQSSKMIKLIKAKRLERRGISNDIEFKRVYLSQKNKLNSTNDGRNILATEIHKKEKDLNKQYKSRWFDDDKIKEMME